MTFSQYVQNLGFLLAQWLPICGLMYLAIKWGVEHGYRANLKYVNGLVKTIGEQAALAPSERGKLPTERE